MKVVEEKCLIKISISTSQIGLVGWMIALKESTFLKPGQYTCPGKSETGSGIAPGGSSFRKVIARSGL